jgi:hypothetical protein
MQLSTVISSPVKTSVQSRVPFSFEINVGLGNIENETFQFLYLDKLAELETVQTCVQKQRT